MAARGDDRPILVLHATAHTDSIPRVVFTKDGKTLISVSKDRTVRLWDVSSGAHRRTLRVPIGAGREGTLYAVAVAPDGHALAVGGLTPAGKGHRIYLIDL